MATIKREQGTVYLITLVLQSQFNSTLFNHYPEFQMACNVGFACADVEDRETCSFEHYFVPPRKIQAISVITQQMKQALINV